MSEKYYIGKKTANLTKSPELLPFSKVVIIVGDDEESGEQVIYEAGDDSGRTLELTNPWGTQQIADDMLARIRGYVYKPFEARDSLLSDDADLGDAVTVGDVYSVIVNRDLTFDGLSASTVSAPNADETDNEFGNYRSAADRMLARRFNGITTRFVVERGRIETLIDNVETGLSSRIEQTEASITMEINRAEGAEQALTTQLSILDGEIATKITSGEAQTQIQQNLENIVLSAVAGENQSTITLSANGVYIDSVVAKFSNIVADSIVANSYIESPTISGGVFKSSGSNGTVQIGNGELWFGYYGDFWDVKMYRMYDNAWALVSDIYPISISTISKLKLEGNDGVVFGRSSWGYSKPSDSSGSAGQVFFLLQ